MLYRFALLTVVFGLGQPITKLGTALEASIPEERPNAVCLNDVERLNQVAEEGSRMIRQLVPFSIAWWNIFVHWEYRVCNTLENVVNCVHSTKIGADLLQPVIDDFKSEIRFFCRQSFVNDLWIDSPTTESTTSSQLTTSTPTSKSVTTELTTSTSTRESVTTPTRKSVTTPSRESVIVEATTASTTSIHLGEDKESCEGHKCTVTTRDIVFEKDMKLTAKNREMNLIMEQNGNLVLYCSNGTPIWESGTKGESIGAGLIIQTDGNMLLHSDKTHEVIWESGSIHNRGSGLLSLVVEDDNNLVLFDSRSRPLWATYTRNQCKVFPKKGGCLDDRCVAVANGEDAILAPGQSIKSENGEITLIMQRDGNLVLYCQGGDPIWHTDTWYWQTENNRFVMKNTGEMMVVSKAGTKTWSSYTSGNSDGVKLVAQNDNNLVLYKWDNTPIWQSNTFEYCKTERPIITI